MDAGLQDNAGDIIINYRQIDKQIRKQKKEGYKERK